MFEKPEIVREMEELDRLRRSDGINNEVEKKKSIYSDKFELEDDLDDIWFSLWNLI